MDTCENESVVGKFKEKSLTYEIPDMKLATPIEDVMKDEVSRMSVSNGKTEKNNKGRRKGKKQKSDSVTNTSSSIDTTFESSLNQTKDTDTILSEVIEMQEDTKIGPTTRSSNKPPTKKLVVKLEKVKEVTPTMKRDDVEIVDMKQAQFKQTGFDQPIWIKERGVLMIPKQQRPPVTHGFTHNVYPPEHDYSVWKSLGSDMAKCSDWDSMVSVIQNYIQSMSLNVHVESISNVRLTWDKQDTMAHSLFPRDGPYDRSEAFEINTEAVGDCLPAAVSRLTYGTQFHANEIRLRMTVEAMINEDWYLEDTNLALDLPPLATDKTFSEKYVLFCGVPSKDVHNLRMCYQKEVLRCSKPKQECALWQIHHLSSVIRRPIISIFPEFDDMEELSPLRYYHNRTIMPRLQVDRQKEPVVIMWTKASPFSKAVANHFVPVVR